MEYKITKEQILEGAKKCPTAEGVLEAMFPDAFADEWVEVNPSRLEYSKLSRNSYICFEDKDGIEGERMAFRVTVIDGYYKYKAEKGKLWRHK
jgi:hypothetical protein